MFAYSVTGIRLAKIIGTHFRKKVIIHYKITGIVFSSSFRQTTRRHIARQATFSIKRGSYPFHGYINVNRCIARQYDSDKCVIATLEITCQQYIVETLKHIIYGCSEGVVGVVGREMRIYGIELWREKDGSNAGL